MIGVVIAYENSDPYGIRYSGAVLTLLARADAAG